MRRATHGFATWAVFAAAACTAGNAFAEGLPANAELRPDLPYRARRSDPVTHEVNFSVVVTPPYHCKLLRVWLPLAQSDFAQQVDDIRLETFPEHVEPQIGVEPVYGNKFAYFEFHEPQGAQVIRLRMAAKLWNLDWSVEPQRVQNVARWHESFRPYLQPQPVARKGDFDALLADIVRHSTAAGSELVNVMQWIDENLTYDHAAASLRADANHAFELRRGHCSDYHGLCATMGRALGYPTRVTYGLALFPKNSPSHCKLEVFLPPYGWVSYDLSETQKLVKSIDTNASLSPEAKQALAQAARQRLHRGFRENSWLLVTKGTDYELVPRASRPVRVVRTIYAEADGEPLPDPDPANPEKREFAWMTAHQYRADKPFKLPFQDLSTLETDNGIEIRHERQ
jgi:hypothetical protein